MVVPMLVAAQNLVSLHGDGQVAWNTVGLIWVKDDPVALRLYQETGMP